MTTPTNPGHFARQSGVPPQLSEPTSPQSHPTMSLNPDTALVIGRRLGNDQLPPRQLAAVLMALLRCDSPDATKQILQNLIEGIATTDPDARHSLEEFMVEVTDLAHLRETILGL